MAIMIAVDIVVVDGLGVIDEAVSSIGSIDELVLGVCLQMT